MGSGDGNLKEFGRICNIMDWSKMEKGNRKDLVARICSHSLVFMEGKKQMGVCKKPKSYNKSLTERVCCLDT